MSDGWKDSDEDDDDYFSEVVDDAELTDKEPKFFKIGSMGLSLDDLSAMKIDDLISTYIAARNQLATDRKGYKAREAKVKLHLGIISMQLLRRGDELGVDNFKTASGTAFRNKKESFRIVNWDGFVEWLKQTHNFHVLQKRVSPNAVKDVRTEEGSLPPGVEPFTEIEFAVRSPTSRKSK